MAKWPGFPGARVFQNPGFNPYNRPISDSRETCGVLGMPKSLPPCGVINGKMATGSCRLFTLVFTNLHYMIFLLFIIECIIVYVGGRDDNIAYSAGSQPAFAFGRQGRARLVYALCATPTLGSLPYRTATKSTLICFHSMQKGLALSRISPRIRVLV